MADVKVTISPQLLNVPRRLEQALDKAHEDAARAVVNEVRFQIIDTDAVATKGLLNSVAKQFEQRGSVRAWLIGSDLKYAPFLEYGRRPGKRPPMDAILRWIVFKGISTPNPRTLAFLIARSIGKKGTKGKYPFKRAVEKALPDVEAAFRAELDKAQGEFGR